MRESMLVHDIIRGLYGVCQLMRANVGSVRTADGRRFSTGLPKGFPDLFGIIPSWLTVDGHPRTVFIECKVKPNKPTPEQLTFIEKYRRMGCIAGVAYSVDDAWGLILPYLKPQHHDDDGALTETGGDEDGTTEDVRGSGR